MKAVMAVLLMFLLVACSQTREVNDGPSVGGGPDEEAPTPDYVGHAGDEARNPSDSPDVPPLATEEEY
ncbi:hypothetical protein HY492_02135 [Candidatus Woesearchaeota archaeon]|nr:hypothetical protein [Candidatus Woesearchaeota archaeon]